ncbi:MAG: HAD-IB family phosphatase [Candidatus Moranbacteria bacterium]|nr:HAD-IB family phosphatase [Candidatus Moranbacteria bacterium]
MEKYLILDFDSTISKVEGLDELAKKALEGDAEKDRKVKEIIELTNLGMEGAISFSESLERRIQLVSADKRIISEAAQHILDNISDSVIRNADFFRENAGKIYIISGGFVDLIVPTAEKLGIARENILANEFVFDENDCVCGVNKDNFMSQEGGKIKQINELELDQKAVMVGDGWTDCQTKECASVEKFIAFTENVRRDKVVRHADAVANDFEEVIMHLI